MLTKGNLKFINSLHKKKYRQEHNLFTVEGQKNIEELLKSNFEIYALYLTEGASLIGFEMVTKPIVCSQQEIEKASYFKSNNFGVAIVKMPSTTIDFMDGEWGLALDQVRDPGNLGTIVRAADWYGIKSIYCSSDCVDLYNPKVIAATMGSFLRVQVVQVDLVSFLKKINCPIYGAILGGENIHGASEIEKGLLVMGNESVGVSSEIQGLCSKHLMIPAFGATESLNVAMATTVLLDNLKRLNP